MKDRIHFISRTAVGIALFTAVSLCLQVPFFENYYYCLGYIVLAVYSDRFGPLSAAAVGGLGTVVYCTLTNGLRGMPGWAFGNVLIAVCLSFVFQAARKIPKPLIRIGFELAAIIIITAAGILGIKSLTEHILYAQPFLLRAAKNSYAFIADSIMLGASLPVRRLLPKQKPFAES
jgi:uncharacterized membrane protein